VIFLSQTESSPEHLKKKKKKKALDIYKKCYHYIYANRMKYLFVAHGNISASRTKLSVFFNNDGSAFISYRRILLAQAWILLGFAEVRTVKIINKCLL
jgi:hypothetical protein